MTAFSSWRALFVREYLEHRVAFQWAPLGILTLLAISGLSAITLRPRPRMPFTAETFLSEQKLPEMDP